MNCEVKFSVSKIENDNNNDIKGKTIKLFIIENKHDNVLLFQSLEYLSFSLHWGKKNCVFKTKMRIFHAHFHIQISDRKMNSNHIYFTNVFQFHFIMFIILIRGDKFS